MAKIPNKPTELIEVIETMTESIEVQIPLITENGGSTILAYELAMDDGLQGDFKAIYRGVERRQVITEGVKKGNRYRLMYRVQNTQGWSEYSGKTFVLAASKPSKPTERV